MPVFHGVIEGIAYATTKAGSGTALPVDDIVTEAFGGDEEPLNGYQLVDGVEDVGAYTRNIGLPMRNVGSTADTALKALVGTRIWLDVTRNGSTVRYGGERGALLKRHTTGGFTSGGANIVLYTLSMSRSASQDPFTVSTPTT
jgi:hypothetical protein